MTEPVAYRTEDVSETLGWRYSTLKPVTRYSEPLYTANQLHQRVKMTQAEFDEFKLLYNLLRVSTVIRIINTVENNESKRFTNLKLRLNKTGKDLELIILWADYDADNPEETIEIVPDMKWFVRSKKCQNFFLIIADKFVTEPYGYLGRDELGDAQQFDTKEEAEEWTNPLTEAVQLPVEGE